ncbi:MAG: AAA family ATPase, partial [Thermoplasmata archaeon]
MGLSDEVAGLQREHNIVGRARELESAIAALRSRKHLMIEGPVGVGKTVLASAVAKHLGVRVFRVDGDE